MDPCSGKGHIWTRIGDSPSQSFTQTEMLKAQDSPCTSGTYCSAANTLSSSPSLGNSATRSFTIFPKLPIELRLVIWEFAVPCDRVVTIVKHGFPPEYFETEIVAHARVPAIFGVNQESRSVALKIYSLKINGENHELCPTLMDPVNDILVLPSFTITPDFFSKQSREMRAVFDILYAKLERLMLHPQHVIFDELQNSVEYEDPRSIYEDLDDPAHDFSWERLLKFRNLRFMGLMGHYEGRNENYARVGLDEFRVGAEARYQKVRGFWESESDGEDWKSARVPEYAMMDTQYWVSSMPISK